MNYGANTAFGFSGSGSGGGGGSSASQFMWVVGGPANFSGAPGAGATVFNNAALAGKKVRVTRGGLTQMGLNPLTGNTYYTKNLADSFLTFSAALGAQEEITVETL